MDIVLGVNQKKQVENGRILIVLNQKTAVKLRNE
jgi:hypothetical protein